MYKCVGDTLFAVNEKKSILNVRSGGLLLVWDNTGSVGAIMITWAYLSVVGEHTRHVSINGDSSKAEAGEARLDISKAANQGTVYFENKSGGAINVRYVFIGY